jgi:hypothetical protein
MFVGLSGSMYRVASVMGRPEAPPSADDIFTDLKSRITRAASSI